MHNSTCPAKGKNHSQEDHKQDTIKTMISDLKHNMQIGRLTQDKIHKKDKVFIVWSED